jgi:CRP-like cAMP-binding protein
MPVSKTPPLINRLLAGLPGKPRKAILQSTECIDLLMGDTLCERGEPCRYVYFPLSGLLSLVWVITGHAALETRLIGNEGMFGSTLALGVQRAPQRVVVQGAGTALRMSTEQFLQNLQDHAALSRIIKRYMYVVFEQLAQTAACNRFHEVESRLARRLLMSHDHARCNHFHLTHQNLAEMLGVLRSAVTIAAGTLQQRGLIHYSRGEITILNRGGLEACACECYAIGIAEYNKLNLAV